MARLATRYGDIRVYLARNPACRCAHAGYPCRTIFVAAGTTLRVFARPTSATPDLSVLAVIHLVYNALRVRAGHARRTLLFNKFKEFASCPSVGRPIVGEADR